MHSLFLADDEVIIVRGLRKLLDWASLGIEIIGEATNGEEAERRIASLQPDIAIIDIHMPLRTGLQILRAIHERDMKTRVIFLTGHREFDYVQEAMRYGAKAFLTKPVKKDELISVLRETLGSIERSVSTREAMAKLSELERSPYMKLNEFQNEQQQFTALACYIRDVELMEREVERRTVSSVFRAFEEEVSRKKLGIVFTKKNVIYIILGHMEQGDYAYDTAHRLTEYIKTATGKELLLGVGVTVSAMGGIRTSIDSAQNALGYRFMRPDERIFRFEFERDGDMELSGTEQMERVMLYLTTHYAENISLESMAKVVHMSPSYFSTVFKKNIGMNFKDCLTKIRMEKALYLLRGQDLKTYELAERVGFGDSRYFSGLFKKTYGKTPMEFKREKKL